ncbi:MAG: alpha-amylase family glycosyl hydrolase, partial [Balneolaceae bacterium]
NANIYEVNIRQYTSEGTFNAFSEHLPRLKEMGVKILWLMPIHPIGEKKRKGTLGSYYSVVDFKDVNPEFGTRDDFRNLVQQVHELDMKIIIDWVANHTAWDAVWTQSNPEFYSVDDDGNFFPPVEDWEDVIQLNFENEGLRAAMHDALEYWVREFNIDGYRCDVAYFVPTDFWNEARRRLDSIKPVFMLAEAEVPELHEIAFDMSYAWDYAQTIRDVGAGLKGLDAIDDVMEKDLARFAKSDYRMYFTTNHDENSWKGSDPDLYGENFENFAVMSATIWGMPLIYSGQEEGLDKQLEFFEKDEIEWGDFKYEDFFTTLLNLNRNNRALWNGEAGGDFVKMPTNNDNSIYSYKRVNPDDEVFVILNFSNSSEEFTFIDGSQGLWNDVFNDSEIAIEATMSMPAHGYLVLEK